MNFFLLWYCFATTKCICTICVDAIDTSCNHCYNTNYKNVSHSLTLLFYPFPSPCYPSLLTNPQNKFRSSAYNFFGLNTLYNVASIIPNVVKVPPMIAHKLVK